MNTEAVRKKQLLQNALCHLLQLHSQKNETMFMEELDDYIDIKVREQIKETPRD